MKPKHRVMCPGCGREKMVFETEKKAQTFLKFNMDEINPDGTREMRVYWCEACGGYHISSHKKPTVNKVEKLIKAYRQATEGEGIDPDISALVLCDELKEHGFTTRQEVNAYLRTKTNVSDKIKDKARNCYYKYNNIKKPKWEKH